MALKVWSHVLLRSLILANVVTTVMLASKNFNNRNNENQRIVPWRLFDMLYSRS